DGPVSSADLHELGAGLVSRVPGLLGQRARQPSAATSRLLLPRRRLPPAAADDPLREHREPPPAERRSPPRCLARLSHRPSSLRAYVPARALTASRAPLRAVRPARRPRSRIRLRHRADSRRARTLVPARE